jgi:TctA family transporter
VTRPVHPALPWIGVVAAPLAWVVQLIAGYAFQEAGCAPISGMPVVDVDTEWWIAGISLVAVAVALVGIGAAFVTFRAATEHAEADRRGRIAFMGDTGLVVSLIFLAVIVFGAVAVPSLDACHLA